MGLSVNGNDVILCLVRRLASIGLDRVFATFSSSSVEARLDRSCASAGKTSTRSAIAAGASTTIPLLCFHRIGGKTGGSLCPFLYGYRQDMTCQLNWQANRELDAESLQSQAAERFQQLADRIKKPRHCPDGNGDRYNGEGYCRNADVL